MPLARVAALQSPRSVEPMLPTSYQDPEQQSLVQDESSASAHPTQDRRGFVRGLLTAAVCTATAATFVFFTRGSDGAMLFIASYLMELSLSVDNMFAFYLIFKFYKCPVALQGTCLFWGIIGAIVLRGGILLLSTAILKAAKPLLLVFAGLLVYSAVGMLRAAGDDDDDEDLSSNRIVRFIKWLRLPVTSDYRGQRFWVTEGGMRRATPLLLVLATIELSDVLFAVDSVPAVLGLTSDTTIVYLAVLCAIVGLRSFYTLIVALIKSFHLLQHAVALLLLFIGVKIVLDVVLGLVVPTWLALLVIISTLSIGVVASLATR